MAAPEAPGAGTIEVEVAYARPDVQRVVRLEVPAGTTLIGAVRHSGLLEAFPEIDPAGASMGVYGEPSEPDRVLRAHDRVEIYRPLVNDPRDLRARRARRQRER